MDELLAVPAGLSVRIRHGSPIPLDIALDVAPGEVVALVGPSGSGKTTALRAIAGLFRPAEGRISCLGETWFDAATATDVPARRRRVGMVFQSYALFPHLTAAENVAEALSNLPRRERRDEAARLLARVHLEGLEDRRPGELSGGQQQRVAVARALARRPHALLLDEPFSAVDRMTRFRLQRELAALRRELSMPVILVTHDLEEAARLADRIAVLHRGALLQTGSATEVTTRPVSPVAARLVGIRNIFAARVVAERSAAGGPLIEWRGVRLETTAPATAPGGGSVSWCIPGDGVIVHRRDRPSFGEHENPVRGTVTEALTTELTIAVGDPAEHPLHCTMPSHAARRNGIEPGIGIGVSLKADAIHLMGPEAAES
jgi:molybdate transport system ATP-binding protein